MAKAGFNFEYSKEDKVIHAIELGVQVNAFPKTIPIMASTDNKAIFFSLFVSYRFGVIVDPLHPERYQTEKSFQEEKRITIDFLPLVVPGKYYFCCSIY